MGWLQLVWHAAFGWAGIDTLIGGAAVAVAVLLPKQLDFITDLRKWAIGVAVVAFTCTGLIAHGVKIGSNEIKRQWDAALVKEIGNGNQVLQDAERDAAGDTPDSVRNDRWNRDNWINGKR